MDVSRIGAYPQDGRVHLIEQLTDNEAFYVCDGEPLYAVKLLGKRGRCDVVETSRLRLMLSAELVLVDDLPGKTAEGFDIIRLISWKSERELVAFFELCTMYSSGATSLSFEDFFYALNELFRPPRRQQRLDAIGLYGELAFLERLMSAEDGIDVSAFWQIGGLRSKYDIALAFGNIEIKTSVGSSAEVVIKHEQIFNDDENYLACVSIERNPGGETLRALARRLLESGTCFTTLQSQIELNKRLLRVSDDELDCAYKTIWIRCYRAEAIDLFGDVPDRVSQLSYRLNLSGVDYVEPEVALANLLVGPIEA